ncbi:MAG TPA: tyrosine--tRNA ligase, partial [Moorella mulderi]|nr:tyrosine--tRNA ligase [Moorella mulderi]
MKDTDIKREADRQLRILKRGAAEIITEEELRAKLERSLRDNRPLKVKLGLDPTAPDIHLGHTVVLHKLRQFQELGHQVILIIGDFTGRIGDPTGKMETRRQLTEEEVLANAETYKEQVFKILDPRRTIIKFNSQWLSELKFAQVIELAAKMTVARMLEREDFSRRYQENRPISIHEFFYPLMQAYDSVVLEADVELGGTDQRFNLIVGRHLQREYGQEPQVAILMPLLPGLDGVQKMSKSLGNYVGINEPPGEVYGKIMSLPDELMLLYFELVTPIPPEELEEIRRGLSSGQLHPRDVKMKLARLITSMYHEEEAALAAEEEFRRIFQKGELPQEMPEIVLKPGTVWLPRLMVQAGLVSSTSEARRLIRQGGVKVQGEKVVDPDLHLELRDGMVLQAGKRRFARIKLL